MTEFFSYAGTVGIQVVILFIMILVGFVISKKGLLNGDGAMQMTNTLLYIVTPSVIISSFDSMEFSLKAASDLSVAAVCAVITHVIGFAIPFIIFRKKEKQLKNVLVCTTALSNCGFMGIPMAEAVLGERGVFLVSVYIAIFNIFVWTLSFAMFSAGKFNVKKALINPGVIGTLIGFVLFFSRLNLPEIVSAPIGFMASMNSPLAMIVIGYYLSVSPLKITKKDLPLMLSVGLRLIVIPLICLGIFALIGIKGELLSACIVPACAPTAAMVMMLAAKFGGDTEAASKGMSYAHIFSVVTMPLMITLCKFF